MDFDNLPYPPPDESMEDILPFSLEELVVCVKVIRLVAESEELMQREEIRGLREALDPLIKMRMGYYSNLESKSISVPLTRDEKREADVELMNKTKLRGSRVHYLQQLDENSRKLRVLDGTYLASDEELLENMECQHVLLEKLNFTKKCYVCKVKYRNVHFFCDKLCPDCGQFNYEKRGIKADMTGKVCLVTGARMKIGFQVALKLLRCGAIVICTTRFPFDAAVRYSKERDYQMWKDKLHIFALDFRFIEGLEMLCEFIKSKFDSLDVIINNACQTIKRSPFFYQHLLESELKHSNRSSIELDIQSTLTLNFDFIENTKKSNKLSFLELEQIQLENEPSKEAIYYPKGELDSHGQQIDLRDKNSWMLNLDEVSSVEFAEVFLINSIAPAMLNSKLKSLMVRHPEEMKFIVNVSAMEGKFYRYKTTNHPHTNMAKAALNMMTRTSAPDYLSMNIYMTSVDTGWINDERPLKYAKKAMGTQDFHPPLDEIDAASRILDPILTPFHNQETNQPTNPFSGVFLKNYFPTHW